MHIDSFAESVSNIGEAFDSFNERMEDFEKIYVKMLTNVSNRKLKTTLCTIYNPCFEHNDMEMLTYMLPPNPNIYLCAGLLKANVLYFGRVSP